MSNVRSRLRRIALSLAALPFVSLLLLAIAGLAFGASEAGLLQRTLDARYQALLYVLGTYVLITVVGLPLLVVAWRFCLLRWWHAALAGAAAGAVLLLPMLMSTALDARLHWQYRLAQFTLLLGPVALGVAHGILFWLLALRGNPAVEAKVRANPQGLRRSASGET